MLPLRMLGLLMHLVLLSDADSKCPSETNPLSLDPPELVGEYGQSYFVSCNSTLLNPDLMYWSDGNEQLDSNKDARSISWNVSLLDWNAQLHCNVKANDNECSKELPLTVYQNPEGVILYSLKHSTSVEEGTQYELQCDISNVAPVQNLTVRWYKDDQLAKTDSFTNTSKTPQYTSSSLTVNISREENAAQLRCEAQLDFGLLGPQPPVVSSNVLNIAVSYKPIVKCKSFVNVSEHNVRLNQLPCHVDANPPADVIWYHQGTLVNRSELLTRKDSGEYELRATNLLGTHNDTVSVTVQYPPESLLGDYFTEVAEGDDVMLHWEADGNPSPYYQWAYNIAGFSELNVSGSNLNITGLKASTTFNCTASNSLGKITRHFYVNVTKPSVAAPTIGTKVALDKEDCPLTLMPAEIVVRYGDPASVNCSTSTIDHLGMGWEARSGGMPFLYQTAVTWKVEKLEDWTMEPICYITLNDEDDDDEVQCKKKLHITLYKIPDIVSVSPVDHVGPLVEHTEYQLKCSIFNVAPVRNLKVHWYKDGKIIETQDFHGTQGTPGNESSSLRIIPRREDNGAKLSCEAQLDFGPDGPQLIPTETSEPYVADVHYVAQIACPSHYSGEEYSFTMDTVPCLAKGNPTPTVQWYYQGSQVNASVPLSRTRAGKYVFEAENSLGRTNTTVDITMEYGPSFSCIDHYETGENSEQQPACKTEGKPDPLIAWFKDGKEAALPKRWTRHDSGEYLLRATNKYGTANHTLRVDVLYAPEFKQGNYTVELTTDGNVSLVCSAEGNPSPVLHWNYSPALNVKETTRGSQKNISVTGATSTNAGVYVCFATNKVGSVTRSATLILKDRTGATPAAVICLIVIIPLVISIIILVIICHKWRKKCGQYSLLPETQNDSFPMTEQPANGHTI